MTGTILGYIAVWCGLYLAGYYLNWFYHRILDLRDELIVKQSLKHFDDEAKDILS